MNKVILIGNLTRDPDLSETPSGVSVCRFSIAVNRGYTDSNGERQTDFFNCTAWRGVGENVAQYCSKGNKVAVSGSIQIRNYEDNDGIRRTVVDIVAQEVEFLSSRSSSDRDDYAPPRDSASQGRTAIKRKRTLQSFDDDGDIPF